MNRGAGRPSSKLAVDAPMGPVAGGAGKAPIFEWRVVELVGEGASATVARAERPDAVIAALKVARTDDAWVGREAEIVASLARRWGPSLLDAGRIPPGIASLRAGAAYIATTWAEGESLDRVLERPSLDRRVLAAIVAHGVGRALDELHSAGVRHGDVKLSNIVVSGARPTRDRPQDRGATLIDMGLASRIEGAATTGGTPRYLAPELRRAEPATPAADLFALGIVLAEILDPDLARADDPATAIASAMGARDSVDRDSARPASAPDGQEGVRAFFEADDIARWIVALLAEAPGARPSATWIARRAARWLGVAEDADEVLAARGERIRRAYLAAHAEDLRTGLEVATAIDGPARRWLEAAIAMRRRLESIDESAERGEPSKARTIIEPLGALGRARWIVALAGPSAASWPQVEEGEGALAERLLSLAEGAAPAAWTLDDFIAKRAPDVGGGPPHLSSESPRASGESLFRELTRGILVAYPDDETLLAAEDAIANEDAPRSFVLDVAHALLRRGEVGRAFAALGAPSPDDDDELVMMRAELERRRGNVARATELARRVLGTSSNDETRARPSRNAQAGSLRLGARTARDAARALLARLAWDRGALDEAATLLGDARGPAATEVRALIAYARGEHENGLRVLAESARDVGSPLAMARLEATRGMLEHARGRPTSSLDAFASAADLATRAGAIVEEATYLTGLAAAAVDVGAVARALEASLRAALLWERLGKPALAARALLGRAAAYALVGARHEADDAAREATLRADESGDARAKAFARWAIAETRAPGDARAAREVRAAYDELGAGSGEDAVRAAARLLIWADGTTSEGDAIDEAALDETARAASATARWEWWGARASALLARGTSSAEPRLAPRILGEIVALLDQPVALGSRGPTAFFAARLAGELGDGDLARRFEVARREAAEALTQGCPPEHRGSLGGVLWARRLANEEEAPSPMSAGQVEQLDAIVRSLSSRDRLKPLLEQVLDAMLLWTGVERGLLLLRAPDGRLVPRCARNLARRDLHGEQLALSMGLAMRAIDERRAICATDAFAQVGELHASVHALRLRSVLAVPLVARGDVLGVVYLDDRVRRGAFGSAELAWVRLVASQAALAIADARDQALLRRAVRRAERATARLAAELGAREAELDAVRAELEDGTRFRYDEIAGRSEPMRAMLRLVDKVTTSDVPVLLSGESGTGKELVARAIHSNGARKSRRFVSENCASVPEPLLESTLFGHVRGAFTGASSTRAGLFDVADGGTLFLDEIGEMPLSMQTKLLRVLQDGEVRPVGGERAHTVDVRILGATHRDLGAMVAAGTFREDLFYRLNVVSIRVPALRERTADIPLLVAHFAKKHAGDKKLKVTRAAMDRLVAFPWPGNVRQLENEIRRAFVLAEDQIDVTELSDEVARGATSAARNAGVGLRGRVDALEAQLVRDALERTKGNQTRAAEALGISRFGLQKMMRRLGIRASGRP